MSPIQAQDKQDKQEKLRKKGRRVSQGVDEVLWSCLNRSTEVVDFIKSHGKQLDDDGYKFTIRYYIKRLQTFLEEKLGKKTSVWQEALGKYGPGNHGGPFNKVRQ